MAYKFQRGVARLSGSIVAEEGLNSNAAGLASAGAIAGATTVTASGLGDFGSLTINNTSTIGCDADSDLITLDAQEVSFANDVDVIIGKTGGLALADGPVTSTAAELNLIDGGTARGTTAFADGDGILHNDAGQMRMTNVTKIAEYVLPKITGGDVAVDSAGAATIQANAVEDSMVNDNVAAGLAGAGLAASSGVLAVGGGNGITANANDVAVTAAQTTITSILNDSLAIGRADGNDIIDFSTDDAIEFYIDGTDATDIEMRVASGSVTIYGDLNVQGTTTTIDSTNILVTGSISFEGATANNFETTLGVVDPTADRAINLPNSAGTLAVFSDSSFQTNPVRSTVTELELLDGDTSVGSSITLQDADGFIVNDNGTMKSIPASDIKSYIGSTSNLDVALKDDSETLAVGVNYFADLAGAEVCDLPASPTVGDAVYIKAPSNCSNTNTLTVRKQGSHTIDGEASVVLESPHAAIMCVYVVADLWKIF